MAAKKRTGLGRGISSLIPSGTESKERPVDVFFGSATAQEATSVPESDAAQAGDGRASAPATAATADSPVDGSGRAAQGANAGLGNAGTAVPETGMPVTGAPETGAAVQPNAASEDERLVPTPGARLVYLPPASIVPNAWQPRREFDQEALEELTHSVREFGVLQPIIVRPIPDDHPLVGEAEYELIMGERRLRATKAAGLDRIPAILKETPNDDMLRDALLENLHRSELNPLEEASAYQQLLDDFGITQEELARRIGRSRPQISNTMRLLKLPIDVQRRVAAGVLSAGHARAILSAGEPAAMTQLADKIVNEDLSVRAAEAAAGKSGSRSTTAGTKPQAGGLTGYLDEVSERLGDRLNTRVKVTLRRTKGQIVVDFASVADLNRILVELGDDPAGGPRTEAEPAPPTRR
ncbi:putative chromosome partitioning protein ParB [Pseudoclavibacter endophyticus]|uniref:ParB/RepB/Spo0J family partition protein n=1 Tax=Pseudoclavibacter endophyticus TaxID=1778590 RepID=A0A6H9WCU6_9MICO|nr:ParB/RepB/Spo0J family partition protein [Pseudoclavibacter endophyticus]KAB1648779.1 ParB/RepB/Spo0J family partition protein [Pseudoclavibacter endophyticus]GGA68552.1 putative chromosome partitioning protein ParB [Pseudoclavibacter endophyticus]